MQLLTEQRALLDVAGWWARACRPVITSTGIGAHLVALVAVTASNPPPAVALLGGLTAGSATVAVSAGLFGAPGRIMRRGR